MIVYKQYNYYSFNEKRKVQPISGKEKRKIQPLPGKEIKEFLEYLYKIIDQIGTGGKSSIDHLDWDHKSLYVTKEDSDHLFVLQQVLNEKLSEYYTAFLSEKERKILSRDEYIRDIINYEPSSHRLSSGETALLNLYSRLFEYFTTELNIDSKVLDSRIYVLLLDEGDMGFHPYWKRKYVDSIISFFAKLLEGKKFHLQIMLTTHDPLTLSDIPNDRVVYLDNFGKGLVKDSDRPDRSFGANISDLLAHSFFIGDGLIGDFARNKINKTLSQLDKMLLVENKDDYQLSAEQKDEISALIRIVDEPVVKAKLIEMFFEVTHDKSVIESEIERLRNLLP